MNLNHLENPTTNTNIQSFNLNSRILPHPTFDIETYGRSLAKIFEERSNEGWAVDLITVMSEKISSNVKLIPVLIHEPVTRIYTRFISRVIRRPKSKRVISEGLRPVLIGCADLPTYKINSGRIPRGGSDFVEGLHYHGLLATPPVSRLRGQSVLNHIEANDHLYRQGGGIQRIHVTAVNPPDIGKVFQYCIKTVRQGRINLDDGLLILPPSLSEISS